MNDSSQDKPSQGNPINNSIPNSQANSFPSQTPTTSTDDLFPPNSPGSTVRAMIGGRLITTTLGMVLMVAGLAAGVALVMQPQLLEQKASYVLPPAPTIRVASSSTFGKSIKNCDQKCASLSTTKVIGTCESIGLDINATDELYTSSLNGICHNYPEGKCDQTFKPLGIVCNGYAKETSNCRCKLTPR